MEKLTFEEKMAKLEEITSKLESEQKGLEESIKLYEEAKKIASELEEELTIASNKVALILQNDSFKEYNVDEDKGEK